MSFWPVTVGDVEGASFSAVVDELPEFVGHGEDEDAAIDDLEDQLNAITWH
jgi:predicted RNase H-like HicB family nuclease